MSLPKVCSGSFGTYPFPLLYLPFDTHSTYVPLHSGLDFTAQALRDNVDKPTVELSESFRSAYGNTLKPHHSFIIKPVFSAAMSATPYRKVFYEKLGKDQDKVQKELVQWLGALQDQVKVLKDFQGTKEAKW